MMPRVDPVHYPGRPCIEIDQLQETIKAADLSGKKELDKLGGEDEELTQELEGMNPGYGNAYTNRATARRASP